MPEVHPLLKAIDTDMLAVAVYSGAINPNQLPKNIYYFNAYKLIKGVYEGYGKSLSQIHYGSPDYKMLTHLRENIFMFSAAKTFQETEQMSAAMYEDDKIIPFNEFREKVKTISKQFNETWLKTEYDTAISQSQCVSTWQRIEEQKKILPYLTYSAIGDEVTCSICGPLNGITLPADSPFWNIHAPGNHFNCRCLLKAFSKEEITYITTDEQADKVAGIIDKKMQPMFKHNPGKTEEVFSKEHPYFSVPKGYKELAKQNFKLPIPKADDPTHLN